MAVQTNLPNVNLSSGIPGVPSLNFNFPEEARLAYESLKPFYERVLSFAQGDLGLAKRVIQYTYEQGMRETEEEKQRQLAAQDLLFPQQRQDLLTSLNRRGVLGGAGGGEASATGVAATPVRNLRTSQNLTRQEVLDRAKNEQSRIESQKQFGIEESQSALAKQQEQLRRQQEQEALGMATNKYNVQKDIYSSQVSDALAKEARRVQEEENKALLSSLAAANNQTVSQPISSVPTPSTMSTLSRGYVPTSARSQSPYTNSLSYSPEINPLKYYA